MGGGKVNRLFMLLSSGVIVATVALISFCEIVLNKIKKRSIKKLLVATSFWTIQRWVLRFWGGTHPLRTAINLFSFAVWRELPLIRSGNLQNFRWRGMNETCMGLTAPFLLRLKNCDLSSNVILCSIQMGFPQLCARKRVKLHLGRSQCQLRSWQGILLQNVLI